MDDLKYIVAGTGRSGTGYVSRLLTELGSRCGHEVVFTPWGIRGWVAKQCGLDGEAAWTSFPYLKLFKGPVVHVVRHPLRVIRSRFVSRFPIAEVNLGTTEEVLAVPSPWHAMARNLLPLDTTDLLDYGVNFYLELTRRIEEQIGASVVRLERLRSLPNVLSLCERLGIKTTPAHAQNAIRVTRPTTNQHIKDVTPELEWHHLEGHPRLNELKEQAERYGYRVAA